MSDNAKRVSRATERELDQRLKRLDEIAWLATRYAPAEKRHGLVTLYLLNLELARSTRTSESILGLIRLQWWREALQRLGTGGESSSHELLPSIVATFGAETAEKRDGSSELGSLVDAWEEAAREETDERSRVEGLVAQYAARWLDAEVSDAELHSIEAIVSGSADEPRRDSASRIRSSVWPAFVGVAAVRNQATGGLLTRWRIFRAMLTKQLP